VAGVVIATVPACSPGERVGRRGVIRLFAYNRFQNCFGLQSAAKSADLRYRPKKVLDVHQHDSEPFSPPALTTDFSLDFAIEPVLKSVVIQINSFAGNADL